MSSTMPKSLTTDCTTDVVSWSLLSISERVVPRILGFSTNGCRFLDNDLQPTRIPLPLRWRCLNVHDKRRVEYGADEHVTRVTPTHTQCNYRPESRGASRAVHGRSAHDMRHQQKPSLCTEHSSTRDSRHVAWPLSADKAPRWNSAKLSEC